MKDRGHCERHWWSKVGPITYMHITNIRVHTHILYTASDYLNNASVATLLSLCSITDYTLNLLLYSPLDH